MIACDFLCALMDFLQKTVKLKQAQWGQALQALSATVLLPRGRLWNGASLVAQSGKESTCNKGDLRSPPGLGRSPGGGHSNPLQYSCLENAHGQRSLVGYSPWGRKELDMPERLSKAQHI